MSRTSLSTLTLRMHRACAGFYARTLPLRARLRDDRGSVDSIWLMVGMVLIVVAAVAVIATKVAAKVNSIN